VQGYDPSPMIINYTSTKFAINGFGDSSWLGRASQPAEHAPAYVFLASPESSFAVGEVINVNGAANVP